MEEAFSELELEAKAGPGTSNTNARTSDKAQANKREIPMASSGEPA